MPASKDSTTTRGGLVTTDSSGSKAKPVDSSGETQLRGDATDGRQTVAPDKVDPNAPLYRDGAEIVGAVDDPREGEFSVVEPIGSAAEDVPDAEKTVLYRPFPTEQVVIEEPKAEFERKQKGA